MNSIRTEFMTSFILTVSTSAVFSFSLASQAQTQNVNLMNPSGAYDPGIGMTTPYDPVERPVISPGCSGVTDSNSSCFSITNTDLSQGVNQSDSTTADGTDNTVTVTIDPAVPVDVISSWISPVMPPSDPGLPVFPIVDPPSIDSNPVDPALSVTAWHPVVPGPILWPMDSTNQPVIAFPGPIVTPRTPAVDCNVNAACIN